MPDITMCQNESCPLRSKCYRYIAIPDEFAQSYAMFNYRYVVALNWLHECICIYYYPCEERNDINEK